MQPVEMVQRGLAAVVDSTVGHAVWQRGRRKEIDACVVCSVWKMGLVRGHHLTSLSCRGAVWYNLMWSCHRMLEWG